MTKEMYMKIIQQYVADPYLPEHLKQSNFIQQLIAGTSRYLYEPTKEAVAEEEEASEYVGKIKRKHTGTMLDDHFVFFDESMEDFNIQFLKEWKGYYLAFRKNKTLYGMERRNHNYLYLASEDAEFSSPPPNIIICGRALVIQRKLLDTKPQRIEQKETVLLGDQDIPFHCKQPLSEKSKERRALLHIPS